MLRQASAVMHCRGQRRSGFAENGAGRGSDGHAMLKLWKRLPKGIKRKVAIGWYEAISRFDTGDDLNFMNHGFAPLAGNPETVELPGHLEKHRYPIQHYHNLAQAVSWAGKDAVEVSSGQGGGAAYLFDTFAPRSMIGVDLAKASVAYCNRTFTGREGLSFVVGDAQDLPLEDASCDILINVESSFNYPRQLMFFEEVHRVLRPGGYFLFTDYRSAKAMPKLKGRLRDLNYEILRLDDISQNVARALELDDPRKQRQIRRRVPVLLRRLAAAFSFTGAAAREEIARFRSGKKVYLCAVLRKPAAS